LRCNPEKIAKVVTGFPRKKQLSMQGKQLSRASDRDGSQREHVEESALFDGMRLPTAMERS
jgi:hypothetical protein